MREPLTTAVEQAIRAFERKDTMTPQERLDAVVELAEWGCFSNRQISRITGMEEHRIAEFTRKWDKRGGRLDPAALPYVLDLIHIHARGEVDFFATKRALDAGISGRMLARLTGGQQVTLARHARRATEMMGA